MYEIYKITNTINSKSYIGYTKQGFVTRFKQHQQSSQVIGFALRKHSIESFSTEILTTCDTHVEAQDIETYYISFYNTFHGVGYNMTEGGDGTAGRPYPEWAKKKLSILKKGVKRSEEVCRNIKRSLEGVDRTNTKNPNFGNGFKQAGTKNGRHKDNFTGDIKKVGLSISKSLKANGSVAKGKNPAAKEFYVIDTISNGITEIDKGYLTSYARMVGVGHSALRASMKRNSPIKRGVGVGLQLHEGKYA